jgi:hypothetical protein
MLKGKFMVSLGAQASCLLSLNAKLDGCQGQHDPE